jgi:hypothetical protein
MRKYDILIEKYRKIFRIVGVILGLWGILILLISFTDLRNHYQFSINHNNNVNLQLKFFYQTFILFIYFSFLPLSTSFFLLLITNKNK